MQGFGIAAEWIGYRLSQITDAGYKAMVDASLAVMMMGWDIALALFGCQIPKKVSKEAGRATTHCKSLF